MAREGDNLKPGPAHTRLTDLRRSLEAVARSVPERYRGKHGSGGRRELRKEWTRALTQMSDHSLLASIAEFVAIAEREIVRPKIRRRLRAGSGEIDRDNLQQDMMLEFILKIPDLLWAPDPIGLMHTIAEQVFIRHYRAGRFLKVVGTGTAGVREARFPERHYVRRQIAIGERRTVAVHADQDLDLLRQSRKVAALNIAGRVAGESHPGDDAYRRLCEAVVELLWDGNTEVDLFPVKSGRTRRRAGQRTNCLSPNRIGRILIARGVFSCCSRTARTRVRGAIADLARSEELRRLLKSVDPCRREPFLARSDWYDDNSDSSETPASCQEIHVL
jgi:hypothetical protein